MAVAALHAREARLEHPAVEVARRRLPDHPPLDPSRVHTFGLLIADRQAGPFRLGVGWIRGYRVER